MSDLLDRQCLCGHRYGTHAPKEHGTGCTRPECSCSVFEENHMREGLVRLKEQVAALKAENERLRAGPLDGQGNPIFYNLKDCSRTHLEVQLVNLRETLVKQTAKIKHLEEENGSLKAMEDEWLKYWGDCVEAAKGHRVIGRPIADVIRDLVAELADLNDRFDRFKENTKPFIHIANTQAREIERLQRAHDALTGIIEIGKRDLTNPKYDDYFESARNALKEDKPDDAPEPNER